MAKSTRGGASKAGKTGVDGVPKALAELRTAIDGVDGELLDLLGRRAALVQKVGKAKLGSDTVVHHPGREAQVLARLLGRHKGAYPAASVARIWREIIAASVRLQTDFRVATPANAPWATLFARQHFGEATPVAESANPLAAVHAGRASAAVLPWPGGGGAGLWWRRFALTRPEDVSVIWQLPFTGDARRAAMIVGRAHSAPSGQDRSWLVLEMDPARRNLPAMRRIAQSGRLRLMECDGYISAADATARLASSRAVDAVHWLGAFPVPLDVLDAE